MSKSYSYIELILFMLIHCMLVQGVVRAFSLDLISNSYGTIKKVCVS